MNVSSGSRVSLNLGRSTKNPMSVNRPRIPMNLTDSTKKVN